MVRSVNGMRISYKYQELCYNEFVCPVTISHNFCRLPSRIV